MEFPSEEAFVAKAQADPKALYLDMLKIFHSLSETIKNQQAQIDELQTRVKELESSLNKSSRNSNKPPSSDTFKKNQPGQRRTSRKKGGQNGHKGSTLRMSPEPTFTNTYLAPDNCSKCGKTLANVKGKMLKNQEFEIPEIKIMITESRIESKKCECGFCNFPSDVSIPKNHVYYGERLKAFILYLKNHHMLPFKRVRELLFDLLGHKISEGTFWNIEKEFSESSRPVEEEIKNKIIQSNIVGFDETSVRSEKKNIWVHVASTNHFSYFTSHESRGKKGIDASGILPEFNGIAIHDFYKAYLKYDCSHGFCNAHLIRELISIYESTSHEWAEMMLAVLIAGLDLKKEHAEKEISLEDKSNIYSMYEKALLKAFEENEESLLKNKKGNKELNLLKRFDEYQFDILRFLDSPDIPFDNNGSERALRMLKVKNKISGCFRSRDGGKIFCRIRSILDTFRKQKMPIIQNLVAILRSDPVRFTF